MRMTVQIRAAAQSDPSRCKIIAEQLENDEKNATLIEKLIKNQIVYPKK